MNGFVSYMNGFPTLLLAVVTFTVFFFIFTGIVVRVINRLNRWTSRLTLPRKLRLGILGIIFDRTDPINPLTSQKIRHKEFRPHEPLLELNGRKIEGTKCCKFCGLNESYWTLDGCQSDFL